MNSSSLLSMDARLLPSHPSPKHFNRNKVFVVSDSSGEKSLRSAGTAPHAGGTCKT
jgi:hypothetical protein